MKNTTKINRFNSENVQLSIVSDLTKRIEILEREQFLFLPSDWSSSKELIILKFIAEQKDYVVEFADSAPKSSIQLVFHEIEKAIHQVSSLILEDYRKNNRSNHLYYARVIYIKISRANNVEINLVSKRLNKNFNWARSTESKHDDLFKFTPEYRKMYNDVMQIITNNQVLK